MGCHLPTNLSMDIAAMCHNLRIGFLSGRTCKHSSSRFFQGFTSYDMKFSHLFRKQWMKMFPPLLDLWWDILDYGYLIFDSFLCFKASQIWIFQLENIFYQNLRQIWFSFNNKSFFPIYFCLTLFQSLKYDMVKLLRKQKRVYN